LELPPDPPSGARANQDRPQVFEEDNWGDPVPIVVPLDDPKEVATRRPFRIPNWMIVLWVFLGCSLVAGFTALLFAVVIARTGVIPFQRQQFQDSMSWVTIHSTRPAEPQRFLLLAQLSDRWGPVPDSYKTTHYCIGMGKRMALDAWAYVPRDSELGRSLFHVLEDGREHAMVLEVRLDDGIHQVRIVSIINSSP
jgi:hypothetical protein